ncbi:DUF7948 domain-containing protein [Hyalangium versicolor]|uniref:DUF7948 domain-containing protein n=1 Tax=Hyalangium versicolor TaxID=2861190 RepID=UPI001CCE424F|nr:hypothetical protein [Hyalangium versicolor]
MSLGVLGGLAAGLVLSLTASDSLASKAPPAPPGPPRSAAMVALIAPQPDSPGRYSMQQPRARTLFHSSGVTMQLTPPHRPARELRWGLAGASSVEPQPLQPRQARVHRFVGPRESWKTDLPTWGALYYPGVAPGVDLWLEAQEAGVAYSLRAAHGSDLRQVRLEWHRAQALRITEGGRALEVELADGIVREDGLRCGQERADGTSLDLPCRYREARLKSPGLWEYVIEVDVKEPGAPVWVDPIIRWNTFVGQQSNDALAGLTVLDPSGEVLLVGSSSDENGGPVGAQGGGVNQPGSLSDVVVARYNSDGSMRWTAVFGGSKDDFARVLAVGKNNDLFVAGTTASQDLPSSTGILQGPTDGFVARLGSTGTPLYWVQRVGGIGDEDIYSLVLGPDDKLYAAGSTTSPNGPASDGGVSKGKKDLFVSRLDSVTGALEKTMVLSGSGNEEAFSIAKDPTASTPVLYVTGYTESPDFPLSLPKEPPIELDGGRDAIVLKLAPDLSAPLWGTFIGGHGQDEGRVIQQLPPTRRLMVVGTTHSGDFPNGGNPVPANANAFVTSFDPTTGQKNLSLVVGGSGDDEGLALAAGNFDTFFVGGKTTSPDLPVSLGFDKEISGTEGYVLRMAPDAGTFLPEWGTYVGGFLEDEVRALASGPDDELVIGGVTRSSEMLDNLSQSGDDLTYSFGDEMFVISIDAHDLTPPVGTVKDGISGDTDKQESNEAVLANWSFVDNESGIDGYRFGVGSAPGCTDMAPFRSVGRNVSITLTSTQGEIPPLTPGTWYFATVEAKNTDGLTATVSSNGVFVLLSDGGPPTIPPRPPPGTPCPGQQPDGGTPDGGTDGGTDGGADGGTTDAGTDGGTPTGDEDGPHSPVGWQCGATGGPAGLVLLLIVALGLRGARRQSGTGR